MTNPSRNCLFYLLNTISHYNSTFKIANELKNSGYTPIYVGGSKMRNVVEENGFAFVEYSVKSFCINQGLYKDDFKKNTDLGDLVNYKRHFVRGGYFAEIINRFTPAIVFLDYSKIVFFPDLLNKNVKFVILSTKLNLNKDPFIPPFTSSYIPWTRNLLTRMTCELLWLKELVAKKIKNFVSKSKNGGFSLYDLPFDYLKANKMKYVLKFINCNRVTHFGLSNVPEIILSPQEFDYPHRSVRKNQFYMGPCVYLQREETMDKELENFLQKENLIYCSMGIYDSKYASIRASFINKLIHAFSSEPGYNILISSGSDIEIEEEASIRENILIRQKLPQIAVLKRSKIMITHGGMQSITEAVLSNVPLLVYPLNPSLDQKGNAARVEFHNVGIVGNIITDTSLDIINRTEYLMWNKEILKSTKMLRHRYINSENFNRGMKILQEYIVK